LALLLGNYLGPFGPIVGLYHGPRQATPEFEISALRIQKVTRFGRKAKGGGIIIKNRCGLNEASTYLPSWINDLKRVDKTVDLR
jgi:hypothetical protein